MFNSSKIKLTRMNRRASAMSKSQKGFTLIELMIVVAIIAILASLAVSAYQTYTVRAQVAEGLSFAAGAKVPVVEAFNNTGIPPADNDTAGMPELPTTIQGSYVASVSVSNGRIDITFGNDVHADALGDTLSLTPYQSPGGGSFLWRCGYAPAPTGTTEMTGGGVTTVHQDPTLEERYLPTVCRQ